MTPELTANASAEESDWRTRKNLTSHAQDFFRALLEQDKELYSFAWRVIVEDKDIDTIRGELGISPKRASVLYSQTMRLWQADGVATQEEGGPISSLAA